jgi:hypothetical protein
MRHQENTIKLVHLEAAADRSLRRLRVMRNALLDWQRVPFKRCSAGRVLYARIS